MHHRSQTRVKIILRITNIIIAPLIMLSPVLSAIINGRDVMHEKLAATVRHNNRWTAAPSKVQFYILSKASHNFPAVQAIRPSILSKDLFKNMKSHHLHGLHYIISPLHAIHGRPNNTLFAQVAAQSRFHPTDPSSTCAKN